MTKSLYCPCSVNTFSQAFESRARFCFRQASTTMSPSFIWARQNRETSRAQASCPCCAEAVDANKTNGKVNEITKAKRIMDGASRRATENGVLEHDPEKWKPVFQKRSGSIQETRRFHRLQSIYWP